MFDNSLLGLAQLAVIRCRVWNDECVIYNQLTGETHMLEDVGAEIFKLISEKTVTRPQLLQNIGSVFEFDVDFDVEQLLDNLIMEYLKLGLVEVTEIIPA